MDDKLKDLVEFIDIPTNLRRQDISSLYNYLLREYAGNVIEVRIDSEETGLLLQSPLFSDYKKARDKEVAELKHQHKVFELEAKEKDKKAVAALATVMKEMNMKINASKEEYEKTIQELSGQVEDLKNKLEESYALNQYTIEEYDNYISELETRLANSSNPSNPIPEPTPTNSDKPLPRNKGKVVELSYRVLTEVVRLYCMGKKKSEIVKETGASRGQIDRIVSGKLYHKSSRQKVLRAVNHLLKVNQNKDMIQKLKKLKGMYQIDMNEDLEVL